MKRFLFVAGAAAALVGTTVLARAQLLPVIPEPTAKVPNERLLVLASPRADDRRRVTRERRLVAEDGCAVGY